MAMRLSEMHPALVHFPLTLLPVAVGTDTIGAITRNRRLYEVGRWSIVGAAVATAVAGLFGLIAQEAIDVDDDGRNILKTHRSLNLGLFGALTAMSLIRTRQREPRIGYLIAGLGAFTVAIFSAYLGGRLVYDHGAGVVRTRGLGVSDEELTLRNTVHAASQAARDLGRGVKHTAQDLRKGDIVPTLMTTRRTT